MRKVKSIQKDANFYRDIGNYCDAGLDVFIQGLSNISILFTMNKSYLGSLEWYW